MSNIVAFTAAIDRGPPPLAPQPPGAWGSAAQLWWRRTRLLVEAVGWLVFAAAIWAAFVE